MSPTRETWLYAIECIEEVQGFDLPQSIKIDAARVCDHLYRMNPERGKFDPKWSVEKVCAYLETLLKPYRPIRA